MTEPKRWTTTRCEACGPGSTQEVNVLHNHGAGLGMGDGEEWHAGTPVEVVAAADFDRLRDERDSLSALYVAAREPLTVSIAFAVAELARVAAVLADALRNAPCYCDHPLRAGLPPCSRCSALAVFDTLTENEPCGHSRECNRRFAAGWGQRSKTDPLCTCDTLTEEKTDA